MGIVDSLSDAFNRGVSGTERLLEIGKLKTALSNLAKTRTDVLASLGAIAYAQYRASAGSVDEFTALGERIRAIEIEIAQTQSRLEELEAAGTPSTAQCAACGHENALAARFCVKCGAPAQVVEERPACAACGAELPKDGRFCVRCGTSAPVEPSPVVSEPSEEAS
jgi:ribosomal protein L40E